MDVEKTHTCGSCGKGFKRSDNLKKHLLIHAGIRPYQCSICDKSFRERNHLNSHVLLHTGVKPYKCNFCEKTFNQKSNLKKHIKIHMNDRPFVCNVCHRRFTQQCYLNEHMKIHTGERDFECDQCGKKFKNTSHLKSHLKSHSDERPYKCTLCDKTFKYIRNYSVHMLSHDGDSSCQCMVCSREFPNRNDLKLHMLVHSNIQLHECFVCGKDFRKVDNFKRHLQAHTGERPFTCALCDDSFKSMTHLKFHMMLHTGEKPFICEVCGTGFRSKSYLNSHMVSHTTERHHCNICGKSFKYKCNYTRHKKTHGEKKSLNNTIRISLMSHPSKVIITTPKVESNDFVLGTDIVRGKFFKDTIPELNEVGAEDERITVVSCSSQNDRKILEYSGKRYKVSSTGHQYQVPPSIKICTKVHYSDEPFECIFHSDAVEQSHQQDENLQFRVLERSLKSNQEEHDFNASDLSHTKVQNDVEKNDGKQCKICGKTFERKYFLKRHMLSHTEDRAYECDMCHKKFKDKAVLKTHAMIHTGEKRYSCSLCDKKFIQSSDQKRHLKTHEKIVNRDKPFLCDICGLKFVYKHNLETHTMIHAMSKDTKSNDDYGDSYKSQETVSDGNSHTKQIISSIMEQFTIDDFVPITQNEETVTHIITEEGIGGDIAVDDINSLTHNQLNPGIATCSISEESAVYQENCVHHKSSVCVLCGKDCKESALLKTHMKLHKLDCMQCGKHFNTVNSLKQHMINHTVFGCIFCEEIFKENEHLKTHMLLVHGGECLYECNICSKKFAQKSNLLRHKKAHAGERHHLKSKETCHSVKKLKANDELEAHPVENPLEISMMHENVIVNSRMMDCGIEAADNISLEDDLHQMIYRCPVCEKEFSKKSNMKRHLFTHTGERPYECTCCNKSFKEKKCRDEHEMTHSGIRPHECTVCNKRFTQKSVLNRHEKTHTEINGAYYIGNCNAASNIIVGHDTMLVRERNSKSSQDLLNNKEEIDDVAQPVVEIQVGKLAVQAIPYEAGMRRRQQLREQRKHKCSICSKDFNRKSNLMRHMQCHKDNGTFTCKVCKMDLKNKQHLDTHMLVHNIRLCQSITCDETFGEKKKFVKQAGIPTDNILQPCSSSSFTEEIFIPALKDKDINCTLSSQELQQKEGSLFCSICGLQFQFKHHLENHQIIHEQQKNMGLEKRISHKIIVRSEESSRLMSKKSVETDGKTFDNRNKVITNKETTFESNVMGVTGQLELGKITVKTLPYSVTHQNQMPGEDNKKQMQCSVCGKIFSSNYNLKRHMRLHLDDSPYVCETCGEKFNERSYLDTHIIAHHSA